MKDFVSELGCMGFTMRLKRISDAMMHEGRKMYKELGFNIEPNWYIIFRLLKQEEELSVTEIADRILIAHPSVIAIVDKMTKAGYIQSEKSSSDSRKRVIRLTRKAHLMLPQFEQVWEAGERGIVKALEGTRIMELISTLEEKFFTKGFKERTLEELNHINHDKHGA